MCTYLTWPTNKTRLTQPKYYNQNFKTNLQTLPHTHIESQTHTQIPTNSKTLYHWFQIMLLTFQHQLSNMHASKKPKHNHSLQMYALQQIINLTLTLTNNTQEIARIEKPSMIPDSATIFSLTRHKIALPSKTLSQIIDSSLLINSHLNQPVEHMNHCLQLAPDFIYPHFIL